MYFKVSICFLGRLFHGRQDGEEPEWPPSPLRVYQALIAAAARKNRGELPSRVHSAFQWLEGQSAPLIIAPKAEMPSGNVPGYCLSVPNNAMDIVAKAWCRGNDSNSGDANPATHRTMKTVRPVHLIGGDTVHYLWSLPSLQIQEITDNTATLSEIARNVIALGWGVDMVVGQGALLSEEQAAALPGERWQPALKTKNNGLRVPLKGTLDDLLARHESFLKRLEYDKFTPPPPLSVYAKIEYRRAIDAPRREFAAFSLLKTDAGGFRAFDAARWALTVAGMTRHATQCAAQRSGWPDTCFVLGHGEAVGSEKHQTVGPKRFAYLPLPTIEFRGEEKSSVVGSVRRVLLTAFDEQCDDEIKWARRALSGQALERLTLGENGKKELMALMSLLPSSDKVVQQYVKSSSTWATVTPVVLPGYDDPKHYRKRLQNGTKADEQKRLLGRIDQRIDNLIRKAIVQAGFTTVLAANAEIEWRKAGFWRGADLADHYGVPDHLKHFPRYHVKIQWRDERQNPVKIPGPICLGGGRFYGVGLFAMY
jgi:CRISPR-associated protein Csb2